MKSGDIAVKQQQNEAFRLMQKVDHRGHGAVELWGPPHRGVTPQNLGLVRPTPWPDGPVTLQNLLQMEGGVEEGVLLDPRAGEVLACVRSGIVRVPWELVAACYAHLPERPLDALQRHWEQAPPLAVFGWGAHSHGRRICVRGARGYAREEHFLTRGHGVGVTFLPRFEVTATRARRDGFVQHVMEIDFDLGRGHVRVTKRVMPHQPHPTRSRRGSPRTRLYNRAARRLMGAALPKLQRSKETGASQPDVRLAS